MGLDRPPPSLCVILWFCWHDKTKTGLKLKLPNNWHRDSPSRYLDHQWILGQKVKGHGHRIKKCKKSRRDSRAAPSRSAVTPLIETAPHGRRELCTLSIECSASSFIHCFSCTIRSWSAFICMLHCLLLLLVLDLLLLVTTLVNPSSEGWYASAVEH